MPKNCASFTRHSRHRPSGWCAVQSDSTVLLSAHRFLSPTHSSSKALSQMPKTLPTSSTRSKYPLDSSLFSFLFHPPSVQYPYPHLQHPPSTTSNRFAGLTSPILRPRASPANCRRDPLPPNSANHSRQDTPTTPIPPIRLYRAIAQRKSSDAPPLPRRRCCEIARALCWQPTRPQRPTRSICLCVLRLDTRLFGEACSYLPANTKHLSASSLLLLSLLGRRQEQEQEPLSQHQ